MVEYNEKAYRQIGATGVSGIVLGICMITFGIVAGIISIVYGANALSGRKSLID